MLQHYGKLTSFCFFVAYFVLSLLQVSAVASDQQENLYSQIVRSVVRLEAHLSICSPGREWAIEKDMPAGSAFFIRDRVSVGSNEPIDHFFVVTARHVVQNQGDLFARVQAGPGSKDSVTLYLPRELWVFNPTQTEDGKFPIDVAVMMIPDSPFMKYFFHCTKEDNPNGCLIGENTKLPFENQLRDAPIPMDRAVFFGFPVGDVGEKAVEPFARQAIVAYSASNPSLSMDGRPLLDTSVFLVDAPAFPGNSGGPVIRAMEVIYAGGSGAIQLFGLMTGTAPGREYSIVTSVKRIHETLVYARSTAKLNSRAWDTQRPNLSLKCVYPEAGAK